MLFILEIITTILSAACVVMIALYATWLLTHRLRRGEFKRLAFGEWMRHLFEAVVGF